MDKRPKDSAWLTSTEAQKALRISSCELMHLREAERLKFVKKGNAFLYAKEDVERTRSQQPPK
jgi:hypothetical protein